MWRVCGCGQSYAEAGYRYMHAWAGTGLTYMAYTWLVSIASIYN